LNEEISGNKGEKRQVRIIRGIRFLLLLLVFQFAYAIFFSKIYFGGLDGDFIRLSVGGICDIFDSFGSYRTLLFLSKDAVNELYSMISLVYGENNFSVLLVLITLSSSVIFYLGFVFAVTGCVTKDITYLEIGVIILLISDFFFNIISLTVSFASLTFVGIVYTINLAFLALFLFFFTK